MHIFEITVPGHWIKSDDIHWNRAMQDRLTSLESIFFEANMALNLFLLPHPIRARPTLEDIDRQVARKNEIKEKLERDFYENPQIGKIKPDFFDVERTYKRERWNAGILPREMSSTIPRIHARAFLYALDNFNNSLKLLNNEKGVPDKLASAHYNFSKRFPGLKGIRDSAHHPEMRERQLNKNFKPIDTKPISDGPFKNQDGSFFIVDNLDGSKYGGTTGDGDFAEVDVSVESMERLRSTLYEVYDSFEWHGGPRYAPME
ncbi:hypothetical protein [Janthinobacterium lividum]|uniref:hypothetical protein n=1 Tax=Janthinobacterium lividum TaxID=29581 RepID=UPI0014098889|nr:hypothetical protein [Janthinobacterium lividum]NHQ90298.1 hypothetical protein [Janthinobacterium lividum]